VYLHGHVNVTKEAAQELSKGMSTIGSQLGLGGTMVGLATAVGKVIAKSGMPPLQKSRNCCRWCSIKRICTLIY
jgi:hypothetical protein